VDDDKTEEPTGKRREEFLSEGKLATSRDLTGLATALSGLFVLRSQWNTLLGAFSELFARTAESVATAAHGEPATSMSHALGSIFGILPTFIGTILAVTVVVGVAVGLAQTGGNWAEKVVGFHWEHLDPVAGLRRAMFSIDALRDIGIALVKATAMGTALWLVLRGYLPSLATLSQLGLQGGMHFIGQLLYLVFIVALSIAAVIAIAEYVWQRRRLHDQMKMSKQEIKDEHKQQEGDPQVKGRMRQRMLQIGRNQMIAATRSADVVVVNPTHYAVALEYKFGQTGAPKLLAKGKDEVAARIREVARKRQIPIVANPKVARAIFASGRIGYEVSPDLYEMVAQIIAYLYRIRRSRGLA